MQSLGHIKNHQSAFPAPPEMTFTKIHYFEDSKGSRKSLLIMFSPGRDAHFDGHKSLLFANTLGGTFFFNWASLADFFSLSEWLNLLVRSCKNIHPKVMERHWGVFRSVCHSGALPNSLKMVMLFLLATVVSFSSVSDWMQQIKRVGFMTFNPIDCLLHIIYLFLKHH